MKIGKRLKKSYESFETKKLFSIEEAVKIVKLNSNIKFDETIDISMNLGVDPRQSEQTVRGMVALPSGTGKDVKVAVFAKNEKAITSKILKKMEGVIKKLGDSKKFTVILEKKNGLYFDQSVDLTTLATRTYNQTK